MKSKCADNERNVKMAATKRISACILNSLGLMTAVAHLSLLATLLTTLSTFPATNIINIHQDYPKDLCRWSEKFWGLVLN